MFPLRADIFPLWLDWLSVSLSFPSVCLRLSRPALTWCSAFSLLLKTNSRSCFWWYWEPCERGSTCHETKNTNTHRLLHKRYRMCVNYPVNGALTFRSHRVNLCPKTNMSGFGFECFQQTFLSSRVRNEPSQPGCSVTNNKTQSTSVKTASSESIGALTSSCFSLLADVPGSSSAGSSLVYLPPIITESALSPCLAGSCLPQHRENVNFGPARSSFLRFLLTSHGLRLLRHYFSHPVWMIFAQSRAAASLETPP